MARPILPADEAYLQLRLKKPIRQRLRTLAARLGTDMTALLNEWIADRLPEEERKAGLA